MLLHFIFVVKEEDLEYRKDEFEYVKDMAKFFQKWIQENFSKSYEIQCDEMKLQKSFKNWELLGIMRLSFMPVPENIWKTILKLSDK